MTANSRDIIINVDENASTKKMSGTTVGVMFTNANPNGCSIEYSLVDAEDNILNNAAIKL